MTSGGARNRSGRPIDPNSGRSERRGIRLEALPAEGYKGRPPRFPLPPLTIQPGRYIDPEVAALLTASVRKREAVKWRSLWRTPQACAWSQPTESWRIDTVALYCRQFVMVEAGIGGATALAQLHRLGDQIGMTTAGLHEMGWKVTEDAAPPAPAAEAPADPEEAEPAPVRRLRAVSGGAG